MAGIKALLRLTSHQTQLFATSKFLYQACRYRIASLGLPETDCKHAFSKLYSILPFRHFPQPQFLCLGLGAGTGTSSLQTEDWDKALIFPSN